MKTQKSPKRHAPAATPQVAQSTAPPAVEPVKIETPAETDILRVQTYKMPPDQDAILRKRLMDRIMEQVRAIENTCTLQEAAQFMEIQENNRGCVTAAEQFVCSLVSAHFEHNGLDLEDIEYCLDQFKTDFEGKEDLLRYFGSLYPISPAGFWPRRAQPRRYRRVPLFPIRAPFPRRPFYCPW